MHCEVEVVRLEIDKKKPEEKWIRRLRTQQLNKLDAVALINGGA